MSTAGDKDTLISSGLDIRATRGVPDLLAARPIYRPDLNLTKENMSSQCIFVKPKPNAPGWHTPASVEQSHQWHRDLTQSEDQVEMQLKPAFQWANEQQPPCKIAITQLQSGGGDQERTIRNVLNAAGVKYTINRQMATLHGNLSGLEEVRLQLLQNSIKLPMTPTEGASQLTIHQVTKADVSQGFQGVQYFCKIGTIEYLTTVRLQVATEHPVLCQHDLVDLAKQISREVGSNVEDLALEQVSPDGGRSTQLAHTFLVPKDSKYLQTPPYPCTINTPTQGP